VVEICARAEMRTRNEVNNLIYMLLKYSFRFDEVNNKDIAAILEIVNEESPDADVLSATFSYVKEKYGDRIVGDEEVTQEHMWYVRQEFFNLPFNLRNDLGRDNDAEEFIVFN
jgi:hypothetical protein